MHYIPKSVWVFSPMLYGSETLIKFPIFYLPNKVTEGQHLKEQMDNHRTLLNRSRNHCLYWKSVFFLQPFDELSFLLYKEKIIK